MSYCHTFASFGSKFPAHLLAIVNDVANEQSWYGTEFVDQCYIDAAQNFSDTWLIT